MPDDYTTIAVCFRREREAWLVESERRIRLAAARAIDSLQNRFTLEWTLSDPDFDREVFETAATARLDDGVPTDLRDTFAGDY